MPTIVFEITTPERTVLRSEVDQVSLPTPQGEITILPHHIPVVSQLVAGDVALKIANEETHIAVSGGFVEVRAGNQVVVLADTAERAEEIDIARAEEARAKAKAAMEQYRQDDRQFADAAALLQKSLVRLRVAKRSRHRGHHGVGSEGVLPE